MSNKDDICFLKELKNRIHIAFTSKDVTQIDYAFKMIDDWVDELTEKEESWTQQKMD